MIEEQKEYYEQLTNKYGSNDIRSLGWGHQENQEIRFSQLLRMTNIRNKILLDVGCGRGDLLGYLIRHNAVPLNYHGIDLVQSNIDAAYTRNNFNIHRLKYQVANVLEMQGHYQVVFTSGIFNLDYGDWEAETKRVIQKMFDLADECCVFNMLSSWGREPNDPGIYGRNHDPLFWLDFCRKLSNRIVFFADYRLKDFTVGIFKNQEI